MVLVLGMLLKIHHHPQQFLVQHQLDYFDKKYKKGWEYGYLFPAFQKTLQNAGRCIRSETDRGVIVFLDERYAWPRYKNCFPDDHKMIIAKDYDKVIEEFFEEEQEKKKEEELSKSE